METASARRRVPRTARVLAVLAMLCTAPALAWAAGGDKSFIGDPLVFGSLVTTAPLFTRDADTFRTACRLTGWGVLAFSALGFLSGLFLLTPAGIVFLAAGSRSRPEPRRLPLLVGGLVTAATLGFAGWMIGEIWIAPYFQEPDAFLATIQEGSPLLSVGQRPAGILSDGSGLGHGATDVGLKESDGIPGARLVVVFDPHTPAADLAVLRQRIADLPGVRDVRLCNPPARNCR
ncbi:hypothetical protein [Kitasatospora sp. NPDC093102]|uniref:hypothetical protein n=1 Tax=Kitasatospora sp. NPDC093102 TaxID=3155069 RepID=UPI003436949C